MHTHTQTHAQEPTTPVRLQNVLQTLNACMYIGLVLMGRAALSNEMSPPTTSGNKWESKNGKASYMYDRVSRSTLGASACSRRMPPGQDCVGSDGSAGAASSQRDDGGSFSTFWGCFSGGWSR
ncbi:predicted protein [Verticillium alfalfae VaMs.102]|uniref:Predicted protein n=1 Tax=Verticillium alfalfae (strain VaMs.102 / ATCC MYA-4576 / FGSC 10136) TaxID=526221 RepID=C9SME0_VERA1|nr:predicted protein [Verticillium alfalfae VaMs.102]EEY19955.1 predicted protein [Verticillium alfalfae VaMs.102]